MATFRGLDSHCYTYWRASVVILMMGCHVKLVIDY